jgi:leader peptidase (prepilin peptidase)/N-methyltransferase
VLSRREVAGAAGMSMAALLGLLLVLPPAAAVATAYLAFTLGLITLSDARHFIIPDVLSLPAIPAGMVASVLVLHGGDWQSGLRESFFGIIAGGGTFYLLRWLYFRWRGVEGLGLGDVKLAAVAGAWLGAEALPAACLLATVSALIGVGLRRAVGGRSDSRSGAHIPFGSFIAPSILAFWLMNMLDVLASALNG